MMWYYLAILGVFLIFLSAVILFVICVFMLLDDLLDGIVIWWGERRGH